MICPVAILLMFKTLTDGQRHYADPSLPWMQDSGVKSAEPPASTAKLQIQQQIFDVRDVQFVKFYPFRRTNKHRAIL